MKNSLYFVVLFCALQISGPSSFAEEAEWRPLFDGSLDGWRHWLGYPHKSMEAEGLDRNSETGEYIEVIGWDSDPLSVFRVVDVDGGPAIYISGQVFGVIETKGVYADYHLSLEFKWGEKRWEPRPDLVRDSGLLYHVYTEPGLSSRTWPGCLELQIQEHDVGDLYAIITRISVNSRIDMSDTGQRLYRYDPRGNSIEYKQERPIGNRCIKLEDHERPHGEWNTVELVVLGGDSIHIVNGEVVMRLQDGRLQTGLGTWAPLVAGRIALQSEAAEVYYRNIKIRPITRVPKAFAE